MKRALLFLLCALMSTQMFSETLFGYLFPTLAYLDRTTCYYLEGEEQNRTLNRLIFEDNMFEVDGNEYIEYNDLWLREDQEGRIFVYSEPAKKDLVLYDFTLEVGDTLTTLNIDMVPMTEGDPILPGVKPIVVDYPIYINGELSCPIDTLIVTDVSMVMMCDSNQYKKWTFSNGMEYMEYIGNLGADFFAIIRNPWEELPTCCVEEDLVCASIYDRLVYLMDDEKRDLLNIDCPCTSWSNKWQWRTNTWNVLQFDGIAFEQTAQTWQYELAHDTIIDGKEYTAVTRHWTAYDESAAEYVAAVRFAENKKAFIYYDNAEYLLYDFGYHEIGDTLEVFSGINNYMHFKTYKCVITDNYSTAGGIAEDTYVMDIIHPITGDTIPSALVWQEFVGSYSGFLHGGLLVPGNSNYQLLCAYKDNVLAYSVDNDAFTDNDTFIEYGCEYNAEQKPKDLFPTLWGLQRTEVEFHTDGASAPSLVSFNEYTPTLVNGKWYLYDGRNYLREENNQVLLYSPEFEIYEDVVLYDWALEIGDTLPFTIRPFDDDKMRGAVFRVTDVSTITLLDGKEYKKWTLACGIEYIEGIGAINGEGFGNYFCIQHTAHPATYIDTRLVCASRNGQLLYQMDDAEMERLGAECLCEVETSYKSQWCNQWNILEYNVSGMGIPEETWRYYLAEDTTINGTTYTTVNRYWTADKTKCGSVATIRFTENQKVYALLGDTEYLVYDFSVQVGDTIETIVGVNYGTMRQQLLVHQIDIAMPTGPKTITLYPICKMEDGECDDCDEDGHYLWECCPIEWIEGIGSTDGFLMGYPPCGHVGGIGHKLLCAYKDDELQYINELYQDDYGCEYNAGPFNEKLLGTWRVVGGNEIISISDSIIVFIGLTQKYTASATQLTVERLWIPEEESYRWANCNYTLSNDTLWIDNFMPLLVATYPPRFGPITLVKVKYEDLFPTLWGLQRTSCTKTIGEDEYGTVWGSRSYLMQETQTTTIDGKQYIVFGDEYDRFALREENNKILLYSSILKKDLVLYDFTLEVGDSLPALYYELRAHDTMHQWLYIGDIVDYNKDDDGTILPAETFVVTDISTITLLDGKEYKKWTFDNGMEYVEGIGSFGTSYAWNDFYQLIANGPLYSDVHSQHLVCASKNGQLLYKMDDAEMEQLETECLCEYNAEQKPEDLFPTLWGLQRTSCDEWYDGCGENKSYLFAPKEITEINGKQYLKCGGVFLREEDSKVLIYSFPYEKDLVLYDYTLEVGDTLQNLGIDIYSFPELEYAAVVDYIAYEDYDVETDEFIIKKEPLGSKRVTEVSTITLLDGKEYKRWLFGNDWENGDYYIEGIGNVGGSFGGDYIDIANPYAIPTCYLGERLVCASRNNKLLYQMDPVKMDELGAECLCYYNSGPKKDNAKNGKIGGRPTPTQWNMLEVETKEIDGTPTILRAETFSYTLENDSIVTKGKTFYQLARQSTKDTAITKSFVGALHFGEDEDNRVYFLRDGVEYVLYDFTAEPGDTIEIFAGINNYPQETTYTHVVVDKDTTEDGACRMFLEVVFPDETTTATNAEKVWLAGLGSIDGIVHNAAKRTSDVHATPRRSASSETQTSVMLCAWREDSCLYTTNHPEYDTFGCVYNQDPTALESPTSPSSYQKILREGQLLIMHDGKIYTIMGIEIK